MKLSEEFKREAEFSEKQSRLNFDAKNDVMANHLAGGASAFRRAATEVAKLEAANEALTKRVAELEEAVTWRTSMLDQWQAQSERQGKEIAELEAEVSRLAWWEERSAELIPKEEYHELQEHIAKLQSQLAWTPVAQGLPTEPGCYLFEHPDAGLTLYELVESELYPWRNIAGARRKPENMSRLYERFRRINLPEAT